MQNMHERQHEYVRAGGETYPQRFNKIHVQTRTNDRAYMHMHRQKHM